MTLADTYYVMERVPLYWKVWTNWTQVNCGLRSDRCRKHIYPIPQFLPIRMASSSKIHLHSLRMPSFALPVARSIHEPLPLAVLGSYFEGLKAD